MNEQQIDALEQAVLAVDGVAALNAGVFGEVGTYLPGRRVAGIVERPEGTEVHVTLQSGADVREAADAVRASAAAITGGPVHVFVEDIVSA